MTINDYSVKITVKQPKLDVSGAVVYTPEQSATIHFGRFIKGDPGKDAPKIVCTEFDHKDADGGNVYRQTYSDGSTQLFTAPKGTDGVPATINGRKAITIEQGDNITIQDTRDGIRINATAKPQEQADWQESDESKPTYIRNKPTIPTNVSQLANDSGFVTSAYHDSTKQDVVNDLDTIRSNAASGVTTSAEAKGIAERAEVIARGRATGYVFDSLAEMNAWLSVPENVAKLNRGDNIYIIDTNVPDYWWDGTSVQTLETEHPDLSGYVKKTDKASYSSLGLVTTQPFFGLGVMYDGTLYCLMPTNAEIVAKSSMYKPITPYNLDYAVKVGLTTNKLSLTDDEKTIVQNWIGIIPITAVSQLENDSGFITSNDAANTYVAKESGKGLSSNDYTTDDKSKLAGIEAGAQKNPTAVSQLENDAQYTTKTYVDDLFNSITHAEDYEY